MLVLDGTEWPWRPRGQATEASVSHRGTRVGLLAEEELSVPYNTSLYLK